MADDPNNSVPWHAPIVESIKASDPDVAAWLPTRPEKDIGSFVKSHYNLEKKLGTVITPPGKNATPEEVTAFRHRVNQGPGSADKYDFKKWSDIAGGAVDEEKLGKYRAVLHEFGAPQAMVDKLIELRGEEYGEAKSLIQYDQADTENKIDAWAKTVGKDGKQAAMMAAGWIDKHVPDGEKQKFLNFLDVTGLGNAPWLIQALAENALHSGEGQSFIEGATSGDVDIDFEEVQKMINDPKHPDYEMWHHGNEANPKRVALVAKRDAAYRKKFGVKEL